MMWSGARASGSERGRGATAPPLPETVTTFGAYAKRLTQYREWTVKWNAFWTGQVTTGGLNTSENLSAKQRGARNAPCDCSHSMRPDAANRADERLGVFIRPGMATAGCRSMGMEHTCRRRAQVVSAPGCTPDAAQRHSPRQRSLTRRGDLYTSGNSSTFVDRFRLARAVLPELALLDHPPAGLDRPAARGLRCRIALEVGPGHERRLAGQRHAPDVVVR